MSKKRIQQRRLARGDSIGLTGLAALAGALALAGGEAQAAAVGNLRELKALAEPAGQIANGSAKYSVQATPQWELRTDAQTLIRISLLNKRMFRIWAGAKGKLSEPGNKAATIVEKEPSGWVDHQMSDAGDHHLLRTDEFALRIYKKPLRFELYKADNRQPLWQETQGLDLSDKLSVQTLASDKAERFFGGGQQNGAFEFKGKQLEVSYSGGWEEGDRPSPAPFLMSSRGWGVLRNSWADGSYDLRDARQITLAHQEGRFDSYYFVGQNIREVLAGYTLLTGRARLLPRWAYEYGDADCYNDGDNIKKPGTVPQGWSDGPTGKTPDVIESVAKKYREHDMPGGWILPNDGYGCGYTQLPEVVQGLAKYGFKTGLWTENGVDKIKWEVGTAGSRAQKLDVAWTGAGYQFSLDANQAAYQGILDNSDARPFLWTVMGWAGTQRYAVTWTGDQSSSWDYIRWHIPTLIGSGLSGQAYATGDVDAIFGGSPETFTRDLQWKTFTPVLMGMSGWAAQARKHPWAYEEPYRSINRKYLKLKLRLTPYMYGLAREAEQSGAPLVRGLMWDHPEDAQALSEAHKTQFLLGRDLLVAPVYRSQAASQGWRKDIYLPEGLWFDYWDGRQVRAGKQGQTLDLQVTLDKLPVFVRAGAILPMYPEVLFDGEKPKDLLTLDLYPSGSSQTTLYEDDGSSRRYKEGEFSQQEIRMQAPAQGAGDVRVEIAGVQGSYAGQEARRSYALLVHSRTKPQAVELKGQVLPELKDAAAFAAAESGWFFDASDRYGTVQVKTAKQDIRQALSFVIRIAADAVLAEGAGFPAAPVLGREVPVDSLLVVARPAEEPGHPLENALNGGKNGSGASKPEQWFRTSRNQAQKTGPHEWVLGLGERRMIDGIELAPRNDKNWKYGQIRDYEIYLSDNMGDWGAPVHRGQLKLQEGLQKIAFKAAAGRLLRFRVLSVHNPDEEASSAAQDPMVTANQKVSEPPVAKAFNAFSPTEVPPIVLTEFRVMEQRQPAQGELQQQYLSDVPAPLTLRQGFAKDKPASSKTEMRMNGLQFRKGLGAKPGAKLALNLSGGWSRFRADVGIDDSCRGDKRGMEFQVWGDGRLLYSSGLVQAPAVVKPELDVRGLQLLELRSVSAGPGQTSAACGNWANASLLGPEGAHVSPAKTR